MKRHPQVLSNFHKKPKASPLRKKGKKSTQSPSHVANEEQSSYSTATNGVFRFLEFFAGGGMARAGLAPRWQSVWANDFSEAKASAYRKNWGGDGFYLGDVGKVEAHSLPDAHMAWGSFPCQDLSSAGNRSGIGRESDANFTRSGSFWPFWKLIEKKLPPIVVLENVEGALKANDGADINALCHALCRAGYRFGPMILDTIHWLPQSRKRLFVVAVSSQVHIPWPLVSPEPDPFCHPDSIVEVYDRLDRKIQNQWVWWSLPQLDQRRPVIENLIETQADQWVDWDSKEKTGYILSLMNDRHARKVEQAQQLNRRIVGFIYRRTRYGKQRAEVRFDGVAGCLRTASGGSSRQIVIEVNGPKVRTRLLSPREAARLQGLPESYQLPPDYNEAYDLVGDGLSVPVVRFLGERLLTPLASRIANPVEAIA